MLNQDISTKVERDHSFSAYARFSEKLAFLTPDTHTYDKRNWSIEV